MAFSVQFKIVSETFLFFKATALEMIHDIREAFNELLELNEWMDEETREVAKDKANSMNERIGYPEYITNRTKLEDEYAEVRKGRAGQSRAEVIHAFRGGWGVSPPWSSLTPLVKSDFCSTYYSQA
jgi:predicted metalloendopeptidase